MLWGGDVPWPLSADWLAAEFRSRTRAYFVLAEGERAAVGVFGLRLHPARAHLIRVALAPPWRGTGASVSLMAAALAAGRAAGARRMTLRVYGSNLAALRAYERAGFEVAGREPAPEDASGFILRMGRRL